MLLQQRELHKALNRHGWEFVRSDRNDLPWWADEVWLVRSIWGRTECRLFLTFIIDPGHSGPREPYEAVWSVRASIDMPHSYLRAEGEIDANLKGRWRDELPVLFASMDELRRASQLRE